MDQEYNYLNQYTQEILFDESFSFADNDLFYHTSFAEFCTSKGNIFRLYHMLKLHLRFACNLERIKMLHYASTIPRKHFKNQNFPDLFSRLFETEVLER